MLKGLSMREKAVQQEGCMVIILKWTKQFLDEGREHTPHVEGTISEEGIYSGAWSTL